MIPALERYTRDLLFGEVWNRPNLSPRDRSIVTVAVLITRNQATELPCYLNLALDNGVQASEISEIITHLAFYSGWPNATVAAKAADIVFAERKIDSDLYVQAQGDLLALDRDADEKRTTTLNEHLGDFAPGLVKYTSEVLFRELWLRPALAPRDRSVVTVSALVASGQAGPLTNHLNLAMDNGLIEVEASEMLTQLAFYAGWPFAFSAMPIFKNVFAKHTSTGRK